MNLKSVSSAYLVDFLTYVILIYLQLIPLIFLAVLIVFFYRPLVVINKSSTILAQFRSLLNGVELLGCQCMNCIY